MTLKGQAVSSFAKAAKANLVIRSAPLFHKRKPMGRGAPFFSLREKKACGSFAAAGACGASRAPRSHLLRRTAQTDFLTFDCYSRGATLI